MLKRGLLFFFFFFLPSCLQTENSSAQDRDLYQEDSDSSISSSFLKAREVLSESCRNCHSFSSSSESELIARHLVIPGNPEQSPLYYRTLGSSGSLGPKNMPTNGLFSSTESAILYDWILKIEE